MKKLLAFALIILAITGSYPSAKRERLPEANISKVAHVQDVVDEASYIRFANDMITTQHLPGNRLILINSPGGMVYFGEMMLELMRKEQERGVKMICKVDGQVSSMAFNILSNCDVRLATAKSYGVVHKIAAVGICSPMDPMRCTAKNLRKQAEQLDIGDEPYRVKNAEMMHLSLKEYDILADNETIWTAKQLFRIGYLHAVL